MPGHVLGAAAPVTPSLAYFFEHYPIDATYDPKTGAFDCEICIPISPL